MILDLLLFLGVLHSALLSGFEPAAAPLGDQVALGSGHAMHPVATVQIELLPDQEGAERLAASVRERLAHAGLAHPVWVEIVAGEPDLPVSHRVVVGPFLEFETAERARIELQALGVDGFVREFSEPLIGC